MIITKCAYCASPLPQSNRLNPSKYCNSRCRSLHYSQRAGIRNHVTSLATGTTGTIGELIVCVDLLQKGYEVFRSVSPSCSCDLAIMLEGKLLRVEVRTGYRNNLTGNVSYPKPVDNIKFDVLAVVIGNSEIVYIPDLCSGGD